MPTAESASGMVRKMIASMTDHLAQAHMISCGPAQHKHRSEPPRSGVPGTAAARPGPQ